MKTEIQKIIKHNQSFVDEMIENYNTLKNTLETKRLIPVNSFDFWTNIQDEIIKKQVTQLGFYINGFLKSAKTRKTKAIIETLNLDAEFCINVAKAQEFYSMQKAFEDTKGKELLNNFNQLLREYNTDVINEESYKKLHFTIDCFEQLFKKGRLRIFSTYLLGIPYHELETIKHKCFKEAYAKHIKVDVKIEEIDIVSVLKKN